MSEALVTHETDEKVSIVTLNRPKKLNALSMDMRLELERVLHEADKIAETSVIVLTGAGRSFCVGFDVGADGYDPGQVPWRHDPLRFHQRLSISVRTLMTPWTLRKPVIAAVRGHALGGGCELAMFCDITIAAEGTQFGEPEVLFSHIGPAFIMPLIIGHKRARELIYLGGTIDAQTALDYGMVNRVVPEDQFDAAVMKYARRMTLIAPEALAAAKMAINRGAEIRGFRSALQAGLDISAPLYAATTEVGNEFEQVRSRDGLKAALKLRKAQFED